MFSLTFSNNALKAIRKLDAKWRERLHEVFGVLAVEPVPRNKYDVIKISGEDGFYRIRLGNYRLQYFVNWSVKEIEILKFGLRDEHTYD